MADEVEEELEAVQTVYEGDCRILQRFPLHLTVSLKPRTAEELSLQFVEAVLVIKAGEKYPAVAPELELRDTKGLDEKRQAKLLSDLDAHVKELSGGPMLLVICEAVKDLLTSMNVPDGDCCFCMSPLVMPDLQMGSRPFMKLMSCFHCFHSDCFGRWWRWLHLSQSAGPPASSVGREAEKIGELPVVQCPVCRMVVQTQDVAHVLEFLTADISSALGESENSTEVPSHLINDEEMARRSRFATEFEVQKARGGIIEPKKLEVIMPGMVLPTTPHSHPESSSIPDTVTGEQPPPTSASEASTAVFCTLGGRRRGHYGRNSREIYRRNEIVDKSGESGPV